jgi:hypothetical protein
MTFDSEIDKVKSEIKVLQSKLEFLESIDDHKEQKIIEAYKKTFGTYPGDSASDIQSWNIFQYGYKFGCGELPVEEIENHKDTEPYCPDDPPEYDEIEWDEKDNPPEPTRNKYFERILNAPIDERGYVDLREPASEFRQKLFDGIKSVFYDPEYERTHWSVKVNMAVDEVLTHFQDIIPASQDPIYDDIDKGWNLCLTRIKMSMEHTNE